MTKKIKVNKTPIAVVLDHGYYETEGKTLGSDTAILVSRTVKGSVVAADYERYTFSDAVSSGAIGDTCNGTIEISIALDDSELGNFPNQGELLWSPKHNTYVVWSVTYHTNHHEKD